MKKKRESEATLSSIEFRCLSTMQLPRKMSAQNVMASISRTLGNRHDGNTKHSNEVKLAGEESKDKLYEPKHRQKVVRVLTVVAYVVSVSLAAIILSLYYTFIWDPKDHALYTIRQTSLNSTAKVECLNVTIPIIAELARLNSTFNASHGTRGSKFPTNETESLEKFSSTQQENEEISIEIVPDSPGDGEPLIKSSISMMPVIIQPESEYLEPEQQSKKASTQDSDFGFV